MDTEKVEKARNGNVDEIGNLLMENMKLSIQYFKNRRRNI